jgi:hypothetical protein
VITFFLTLTLYAIPALIGMLLAHRMKSAVIAFLLALGAVVVIHAVALKAPFDSLMWEPLVALAAFFFSIPVFLFVFNVTRRFPTSGTPTTGRDLVRFGVCVVVILPLLMFGLLMPLTERWRYATTVRWACDGPIVEKYRSHNHAAPTLVVLNDNGHQRVVIEGIPAETWERAQVNDHLVKMRGHTTGMLDGARVGLIPPRAHFVGTEPAVAPE